MVMLNTLVSLPALLAAFTVKLDVPAAEGVPVMTPSAESVNPSGKLPFCSVHVIGAVPVAVSVWLYAVSSTPSGKVVVVISGAIAELVMVILNALLLFPALLVAFTVKVDVPTVVGVPLITPADDSVKPVGSVPLANVHVIGAVPEASSCAL